VVETRYVSDPGHILDADCNSHHVNRPCGQQIYMVN